MIESTSIASAADTNKPFSVGHSPFFHPSSIPTDKNNTTHIGPSSIVHPPKHVVLDAEHKTGILGTSANLVVEIIGAGIVGVPYAIKNSGLIAGVIMAVLSAAACDKSLRLLIETAKHVDVTSYETLFEAAFGDKGFKAMCAIMFAMSYGATVSYLMIIKDMISMLVGIDLDEEPMRRAAMVVASILVVLPLSCQRDMADLSKTSRISVMCYLCIVLFVAFCSPTSSSVQSNGGWRHTISHTVIQPDTFFTGFGVLTFAFVCQHSAFIMAGSLERPNRERWSKVAHLSLTFSGTLAILCGVSGYLGFLEKTDGNILFNMESLQSPLMVQLNKVAQAMLLMCMFFVYPMDCFVLRHVAMVLLFQGRVAHGGFDHLVLARSDRRILLTFVLYILSLLPALLLQNLGAVLSITGSVAGSALSYICPGASYLAVHGAEFKKLVNKNWVWGNPDPKAAVFQELKRLEDHFSAQSLYESGQPADADTELSAYDLGAEDNIAATSHTHQVTKWVHFFIGRGTWYLCLMPVWMTIAEYGQRNLLDYAEKEAAESPLPAKPLGKIARRRSLTDIARGIHTPDLIEVLVAKGIVGAPSTEVSPLLQANFYAQQLKPKSISIPDLLNFSHDGSLKLFGKESKGAADPSALLKPNMSSSGRTYQTEFCQGGSSSEEEDDPQSDFPKLQDFFLAVAFITIGVVAMVAGLCSVIVPTN